MKRGILTTEFWLSVLTILGALWAFLEGRLSPEAAAAVAAVVNAAYSFARAWVKSRGDAPPDFGRPRCHWAAAAGALLCALLLAGCATAPLDSADKRYAAVESGLRHAYDAVHQLSLQESASRIDCVQQPPGPACRPVGHYMSRSRADDLLARLDALAEASRFAWDELAAGEPCVQGYQIEALGLAGCVDANAVLRVALLAVQRLQEEELP